MTLQPEQPPRGEAEGPGAAESLAQFIYRIVDEKRAEDIVWLDVHEITDLADDFIIATIGNPRQGAAIIEECEKERKRRGLSCLGIEGESGSTWMLLDYGDVIVHLLMPEARAYYALEHIWADAKRVK